MEPMLWIPWSSNSSSLYIYHPVVVAHSAYSLIPLGDWRRNHAMEAFTTPLTRLSSSLAPISPLKDRNALTGRGQ
jgi:hypothetical protein